MVACESCGKAFDSEAALEQHTKAKHATDAPEPKKPRAGFPIKAAGLVAIVIVIAVAALFLLSKPGYSPLPYREHAKGTGPVEILEFSDFQCPACGAAYPEAKAFIESNSDKAKVVYRHFPLTQIHPFAFKAAEASECAADQGKFWEYHDKLFENQQALGRAGLAKYAEQLGLDMTKFSSCLDSGVMADRVNADVSDGNKKGVRATPTFFIGGQKFEGALTAEQFEREVARA
jgi:protein-disulfide isomerase